MSTKNDLTVFKEKLDRELKKLLERKQAEVTRISPFLGQIMYQIKDLTMRGGKRIRPALLYYSYLAHGGEDQTQALRAAMAVELAETYLLIHDDIMDDDTLRRGGTTIHEHFTSLAWSDYRSKNNPADFGHSIAIIAGNVACALSNKVLASVKADPVRRIRMSEELNRVYEVEGYGQALDIFSSLRDDLTPKDVLTVYKLKTVPYTFDGPIKIGAIMAGADESKIKALEGYSYPLGIAFQIQDDILGMFGSEEKLGKPVTSDLKEGKKTLLMLETLTKADPRDQKILHKMLGNKRISVKDLVIARQIIEKTGSLERLRRQAEKMVKDSLKVVEKLELKIEGKEFLLSLADYMVKREY